MEVYLSVEDSSFDEPVLSKWFYYEVVNGMLFSGFEEFLTEEEIEIFSPNIWGQITLDEKRPIKTRDKLKLFGKFGKVILGKASIDDVDEFFEKLYVVSYEIKDRVRDPVKLKNVIKKVQHHLIDNSSIFPLVHGIFKDKERTERARHIMISDIQVEIEGNLSSEDNYDELREKLRFKSYGDDYGKVDFCIDVEPEIFVENTTFYTTTRTVAQVYQKQFEECYKLLDYAIKENKKVLWEFG